MVAVSVDVGSAQQKPAERVACIADGLAALAARSVCNLELREQERVIDLEAIFNSKGGP
jgi:hypothetical protein